MHTHPVFLRLEGRSCVCIGGDRLIEDKAAACLRAGATVTIVSPELTPALARRAERDEVRWIERAYRAGDLAGAFLVYASCRDPERIAMLRAEAERERVLLNVIDVTEACSFLAPAVVSRGALQIAIGTGGASPLLAGRLRRDLERRIGPEYELLVAIMGGVRRVLEGDPRRTDMLTALLDSPLPDLVRRGDRQAVDELLARLIGPRCTLEGLGLRPDP